MSYLVGIVADPIMGKLFELLIKTLHIVLVAIWFTGLFFLPRFFVYHSQNKVDICNARYEDMERKFYLKVATPSGMLAIGTGFWLWLGYGIEGSWLMYKLLLVLVLVIYHLLCWRYIVIFQTGSNVPSHTFFRIYSQLPVVFLIAIVVLSVFNPS